MMIVTVLVFILFKMIILPIFFLSILLKYQFKSMLAWIVHIVTSMSYIFILLVKMEWSVINYYTRVLLILFSILSIVLSWLKNRHLPLLNNGARKLEKIFISIYSIAALYQIVLLINFIGSILTPNNSVEEPLNLHFPLKKGVYVIIHGGNNLDLNYHYSSSKQKYAIDIAKINGWGWRKTPFNKFDSLESYNIYGDILYSPIAGEVVKVVDNYSDLGANPSMNMNEIEKSNMIVVRNNDYYVFLLHLKQESALVKEGQKIDIMMPIAEVGNSGYSSEPHLHIHVMKKTTKDSLAIPIPITFDGQTLKRNDLIWDTRLIFR